MPDDGRDMGGVRGAGRARAGAAVPAPGEEAPRADTVPARPPHQDRPRPSELARNARGRTVLRFLYAYQRHAK